MGCNASKKDPTTAEIEKNIRNEEKAIKESMIKKILLLGTGDAGKSTFIKQMKIKYQSDFTQEEKEKYAIVIRDNTLQGMRILIESCEKYDINIPEKFSEDAATVLNAVDYTKEVAKAIKSMWKNCVSLRTCWEQYESQITVPSGQNAVYFFQNAVKFADEDWVPNNEEIFRARSVSTGIQETVIHGKSKNGEEAKQKFRLVDVGGQRSERRKWINCFDDSDAVIYLAAINEYDMSLVEETSVNRLEESLNLFRNITQGKWFQHIPWIVFLNKSDLFREKIERAPLSKYFHEYDQFVLESEKCKGKETDFEKGVAYFEHLFCSNYRGNSDIYIYPTNALDTENCVKVWKSLKDSCFAATIDNVLGINNV